MAISFDEETFVAAARAGDFRRVLEPKAQLTEAIRASASLRDGEPREALGQLSEIAARLLRVGRVGLWAFDPHLTKITCLDLFVGESGRHSSGMVLARSEAPEYFSRILIGEVLPVDDAMSDPRTAELARKYLPAFGVGALLDCPILVERNLAGILCAEHLGGPRRWEGWERLLGSSLADCAGVAIGLARSAASGSFAQLTG